MRDTENNLSLLAIYSSAIYIFAVKFRISMKILAANTMIDSIMAQIEKDGIDLEKLVPQLKELRDHALAESDRKSVV